MAQATSAEVWEECADCNAALLDWGKSILKSSYREESLESDLARKLFVLPNKCDKDEHSRKDRNDKADQPQKFPSDAD